MAAEGVLRTLFSASYAEAIEVVETVQETIDDLSPVTPPPLPTNWPPDGYVTSAPGAVFVRTR